MAELHFAGPAEPELPLAMLVIKVVRKVTAMNASAGTERLPVNLQSIFSTTKCKERGAFACEVSGNKAQAAGGLLLQQRVNLQMGLRMSRLIMAE